MQMDYSTRTYKYKVNSKHIKLFSIICVTVALATLGLGLYLVLYVRPDIPLQDKLTVIIGPIFMLFVPVIVSIMAKRISMKNMATINEHEITINGISDRGKHAIPLGRPVNHPIIWGNIVAVVRQQWFRILTVHFIFYIDGSEKSVLPVDIENIRRIQMPFDSVQNREELENEIKNRARNAAILFDIVLPDNFKKWGLTKEACNTFYSLIESLKKRRMAFAFILWAITVFIGLSLVIFICLTQS